MSRIRSVSDAFHVYKPYNNVKRNAVLWTFTTYNNNKKNLTTTTNVQNTTKSYIKLYCYQHNIAEQQLES